MRDAFHLTRPGADPGPAGRRLLAWREALGALDRAVAFVVSTPPPRSWGSRTTRRLQEAIDAAEACAGDKRLAPFAAAQVFAFARRALTPNAGRQSLGRPGRAGRAARGLARRSRARPAPQMAVRAPIARRTAVRARSAARGGRRRRRRRGERSCSPTPRARQRACDLSAELGRRAQKLLATQPKLRAKGAPAALQALLDEDSSSASSKIGGQISERGARRLFDRLVALGAVRELTGRATFRLYGL